MDIAIMLTLVGSFAILSTTHLGLAVALTLKKPRWRGPVALLVPPLAPYWGHGAKLRKASYLWVVSLFIYVLALLAASVEAP
jgi:hypothetical protein